MAGDRAIAGLPSAPFVECQFRDGGFKDCRLNRSPTACSSPTAKRMTSGPRLGERRRANEFVRKRSQERAAINFVTLCASVPRAQCAYRMHGVPLLRAAKV